MNKYYNKKVKGLILLFFVIICSIFIIRYMYREEPTYIYIVRHAITDANENGLLVGNTNDATITIEGEKNAYCVGENLKDVKFDYIYCSPLDRAMETAENIKRGLAQDITITSIDELTDISWGNAEGKTWNWVIDNYSVETIDDCFGNATDQDFESVLECESKYNYCKRIENVVDSIIRENRKKKNNVMIVTHSAIDFYLETKFPEVAGKGLHNTSVTILKYENGKLSMLNYDDTSFCNGY